MSKSWTYEALNGQTFDYRIVKTEDAPNDGGPCPYCDAGLEHLTAFVAVLNGKRIVCGNCMSDTPLGNTLKALNRDRAKT